MRDKKTDNPSDDWDRALLGDFSTNQPVKNKKKVVLPSFLVYFIVILLLITGFFFYRHPESIYANFRDFKNFSNQVSNQISALKVSLQISAILTAASLQETALNLPSQARSFAEQTLNQVRSLSLSLSLSANKLISSANKSLNS